MMTTFRQTPNITIVTRHDDGWTFFFILFSGTLKQPASHLYMLYIAQEILDIIIVGYC